MLRNDAGVVGVRQPRGTSRPTRSPRPGPTSTCSASPPPARPAASPPAPRPTTRSTTATCTSSCSTPSSRRRSAEHADADLARGRPADAVTNAPTGSIALWHRPPYSKGLLHDSDVEAERDQHAAVRRADPGELRRRRRALRPQPQLRAQLLLDGHYGLSSTFSSANQVDPGDGDPAGDGAYRKATLGPDPHSGAVYVVDGSGSEVRTTTLNHPAMVTGCSSSGSVVDRHRRQHADRALPQQLGGRSHDTFRIVKGSTCPADTRARLRHRAEGQGS